MGEIFDSLTEPVLHKKEIADTYRQAESVYKHAKDKFEQEKDTATQKLEQLGTQKMNAWSGNMDDFSNVFNSFKNLEIVQKMDNDLLLIDIQEDPGEVLMNIQNATVTANEVIKLGAAALGTGALIGIASYGGAMLFGSTAAGTAITSLKGVAKAHATLAWFAGGSSAITGSLVFAGIIVAPVAAVAAYLANIKSKAKLAEAKAALANAKNAAEQLSVMTSAMQGVSRLTDNYKQFIKDFEELFVPFIDSIDSIYHKYYSNDGQIVDVEMLTESEQKTLHISWLMAQIYYKILSVPLLDEDGHVAYDATQSIEASKTTLAKLKIDSFKMSDEYAEISNVFWRKDAKKAMLLGFITVFIILGLSMYYFPVNVFKSVALLGCAAAAFPVFIKHRNLPENKKYKYRLIKIGIAVVLMILFTIF